MKYLCIVVFLLVSQSSKAQKIEYVEVLNTFIKNYNATDAEAIFKMMNTSMQEALGIDNVTSIIKTFRDNLGEIKTYNFMETTANGEIYEATFEQGKQNIALALDTSAKLSGLRFLPAAEENLTAKMERNKTPMVLPFKGKWFTVWGGDTKAQNYHVVSKTQKKAFDFLIIGKNGKTYERSGTRNEDYFAFGKPLYAVCDAEVFQVITGVNDNKPGAKNPAQALGNSVTLKTKNDEYIVYAHFEKETITVKEGDLVIKGQYLGNCGNSGNSTEPHLHLHIQDGPNNLTSIGVKCYFEEVLVNDSLKKDYSPIRLDYISPREK